MKHGFVLLFIAISTLLMANAARGDSLFTQQAARDGALITERPSRFAVGDIITVMVEEVIQSTAQASTNTKKESGVDTSMPENANPFLTSEEGIIGMKGEELPNWRLSGKNETKNTGTTRRTYTLKTTVACTVTEVLSNGNLRLDGTRLISMNREDSMLAVSGLVRARDVSTAHTVNSSRLADASIRLSGKGPLWNNQRRGLVTRFLDWASPF